MEFVPKVKNVLAAYYATEDIENKNLLLKSILEKATYLRKKDEFVVQLYPKIQLATSFFIYFVLSV